MDKGDHIIQPPENPWLGLQTYSEGKKLYGRDKDIVALIDIIEHNMATVLFGRSGIGKSSLINAGIFPFLHAAGNQPIYIRFEHNSKQSYIDQILSSIISEVKICDRLDSGFPVDGLWDFLHRHDFVDAKGTSVQVTIVIDQFEEIFTLADDEHKSDVQNLFNELADVLNNIKPDRIVKREKTVSEGNTSDLNIDNLKVTAFRRLGYNASSNFRFVFCLREDYLCCLERNIVRIPSLRVNRYALRALDDEGARKVISMPLPGFYSEEEATDIIEKLAVTDENDIKQIDPTILSIFLYRSFLNHGSSRTEDIIQEFYREETKYVSEGSLAFLEEHLITGQGFRQSIPYDDAIEKGVTPDELSLLFKSRILTLESKRGHNYIELSHDVLCPIVTQGRDDRLLRLQKKKLRNRIAFATVVTAIVSVLVIVFSILIYIVKEERAKVHTLEVYNKSVQASLFTKEGDVLGASRLLIETLPEIISNDLLMPETESALYETYDSLNAKYACVSHLRHTDDVNSAMYSEDGSTIVTACSDGCCYLWSSYSGANINNLEGHSSKVNYAEFSHDKKYVVSASSDRTAVVWDLSTNQKVCALEGHTGAVLFATFSPDDRLIATASADGTVRVWDAKTGKQERILVRHQGEATSCHFSKDGDRIVSSSWDGCSFVMDLMGKIVLLINCGQNMLDYACFSPDGLSVLTVSSSGVNVWNSISGERLASMPSPDDAYIINANFSRDGSRIAYVVSDGSIAIWNWRSPDSAFFLTGHEFSAKYVSFSPDDKHLLSSARDNKAKIWNCSSKMPSLNGADDFITFATFSKTGNVVGSASFDKHIHIWDNGGVLDEGTNIPLQVYATSLSFNSDNSKVAVTLSDKTIRVIDYGNDAGVQQEIHLPVNYSYAFFVHEDNSVVAISNEGPAVQWFFKADSICRNCFGNGKSLNDIALSPCKDWWLMAETNSNDVILRPAMTSGEDFILKGHTAEVQCVAFSEDGQYAASGGSDNEIIIWDVMTRKCKTILKGHLSQVFFVQFSPDGNYLYSASTDRTARIWNMKTGQTVRIIHDISDTQMEYALSTDGKKVLAPHYSGLEILDNPTPSEVLHSLQESMNYE